MKQKTCVLVEKESVTDLREEILQLIEHDCHDQEGKSRAELLEKLSRCKRDTLVELCRSFDVTGSRANRKEELVLFLTKFIKHQCSDDGIDPDKVSSETDFMKQPKVFVEESVSDLREQILQLIEHDCHDQEGKSRAELLEKLSRCKRDTLVELCRSFDITGSRANRKEELVLFLTKFIKHQCSDDGINPDKVASETHLMKQHNWVCEESVTDLREQILQIIEDYCHDQEEKSRAELLEKLKRCKRDTLIELCHSFDLIGSRANRKEELVLFLMEFIKDQCSGDGINPDKKIKKRRRVKEDENLSTSKPSKKKKREGEEEADERKGVEDRGKHFDCDLMGSKYSCADSKNGFPNEMINCSVSENLDGASLSEAPIPTDEQVIITTPPTKFVTAAEGHSTDVKAIKWKMSSITKKKATPKEDCKLKLCGKQESKGDTKPRKQAIKPSKDELRQAVFLILDTADFATMTFGDVVKEVDKYFGKDLFERKPLIRCLIEEELFRLADEAEKKELEESEAAEAKARAEQAAKEIAQVQTVESFINKQNVLQAGRDSNTKDSLKNANDNTNKKIFDGGASVESAFKRSSCYADEGSEGHKADTDANNKNMTKDGNGEKVALAPIVNSDCTSQLQGSSNVEVEMMINNNVEALEGLKDGKVKDARNGENNGTEDGGNEGSRSGNVGSNSEAEESHNHGNNESGEGTEDAKVQEANHNENSANVEIHGGGDGETEEGDINADQSQADGGSNSKAEVAEHNENTKVDANSSKNGTNAENGKTDVDMKGNSDGTAEGSPV